MDNVKDKVIELAGQGMDTVEANISYTLGKYLENLTLIGSAPITGKGNSLANLLTGNSGNNKLDGGAGNDTMDGGAGNDSLIGGAGNDTLDGDDGNDTLDGGLGADTLIGGAGNDTYVVDHLGDHVIENLDEGIDLVKVKIATAGGTYALDDHVENATLLSVVAYNLEGNDLDNVLIGNAAANVLTGNAGNDILNGVRGADRLIGGAGDDIYYVDNALDVVSESDDDPVTGGIDEVRSTIGYSLKDTDGAGANGGNVENLTLLGSAAVNGIGNGLDNLIVGNDSQNSLLGYEGDDSLYGLKGKDSLKGGNGDDMLVGGAGNDTLTGGSGADIFWYDTAPNSVTNRDTITDFVSGIDRLQFSLSVLSALGTVGQFEAADDRFLANNTGLAQDAGNRLIYNVNSGELFYDGNGSAPGGSILIEVLANAHTLVSTDIWIV